MDSFFVIHVYKISMKILCRFDVYLVGIFLWLFSDFFFLLFPLDQLFLFRPLLSCDWSSSYTSVLLIYNEQRSLRDRVRERERKRERERERERE